MTKVLAGLFRVVKPVGRLLGGVVKFVARLPVPVTIILLVAVIAIMLYFGFGLGKGNGIGDDKGDKNSAIQTDYEEMTKEEIHAVKTNESEKEENPEKADQSEETILEVTVLGNDYLYQNRRIEMSSLIQELLEVQGDFKVKVLDDKASLKAYNNLIKN